MKTDGRRLGDLPIGESVRQPTPPGRADGAPVGTTNSVLPAVITMAACQRAWAKRHAPWLLREDA